MISREDGENLLAIETRARDHYDRILSKVNDATVRKNLTIIRDDEIRHIEIAKRVIAILSK